MTETEHAVVTLAHLTAVVHGTDRRVFLTDAPDGRHVLNTLDAYLPLTGTGGNGEDGRVDWLAGSDLARGTLTDLAVPRRDPPRSR